MRLGGNADSLQVGSADNLYNHQSTFMVEMLEVADILNQASPRSFVRTWTRAR